jgi:hypothetical protein
VERHAVARWEKRGARPEDGVRENILGGLEGVPPAIAHELAVALGAAPSVAAAPPVDHRATLLRALTEMDRSGVPIAAAIPVLAARKTTSFPSSCSISVLRS